MNARVFLKRVCFLVLLFVLVAVPASGMVSAQPAAQQGGGNWWEVTPEASEAPLADNGYLYSQIAPKLREIEQNSNRVRIEVMGQSAGGRNLFLATISAPEALGRLGQYQAIRNTMLKDPAKAQEMIEKFGDFKVPVFINASIHGNEITGTDAAIRLIEKLAYEDTPEVQTILQNVILLVNVIQNPDGRVLGTRANAAGFDINRDFLTQTQPETQATVKLINEWNPMVILDLHGFVNPMLIEPCTPPHNPNYEYDLYIKWALSEAEAMESELFAQTGFKAQIPFRDTAQAWDDWSPAYTPMYGMYHGAVGHTLETAYSDVRGVNSHFAASWGMLKFVAANRQAMITDQIEIFRRGLLDLPQIAVSADVLKESAFPQYLSLDLVDFPAAYIIPQGTPLQLSAQQPKRLVDFLLANGVQVDQANQAFTYNGVAFPAGTYLVWMDQPKRGLANTILGDGWDLSTWGLRFYSPPAAWSHPLLWGVSRWVMQDKVDVKTQTISKADAPAGSLEKAKAVAYAYLPTSLKAFAVTGRLLDAGVPLYRVKSAFADGKRTVPAGAIVFQGSPSLANDLANQDGLDVLALARIPAAAKPLTTQKIAIYGDSSLTYALGKLGIAYTSLTTAELNAGAIAGYDLFINQSRSWSGLSAAGKSAMTAFFTAGGDYIGLARTGSQFAIDAKILTVSLPTAQSDANAVVKVQYDLSDPLSAGFRANDYAIAYPPIYFTNLGTGVQVTARYDTGSLVVSGYWPSWTTSPAAGAPLIVHGSFGTAKVTLIGLDAIFRGHPENTFRLLGNAIFANLD